jgi:membrane associated rhomboid family serine protease
VVLNISSFAVFLIQRRAMEVTRQLCAVDPLPYLPLVPSIYPWTLLTATFVEQNIFTVVLNAVTLFYGGKYLERAWGSREFGKFILIVALIPNIVAIPIYLLWWTVTGDELRGYAALSPC